MPFYTNLKRKFYKFLAKKPIFEPFEMDTEFLGTQYGGWTIPKNYLNASSVCYLAGAGTDISFDIALVEKYGCKVHIFDPTPKALQHYLDLMTATKNGEKMAINTTENYDFSQKNLHLPQFHALGVWNVPDNIRFYVPKNKNHVSHSAVNLQKTSDFFEAEVETVQNIMKELHHTKIDLFKIDIEGAEYKVIDNILETNLNIGVLCVEFDEVNQPQDRNYMQRVNDYILKIQDHGYLLVAIDEVYNCSFVKIKLYDRLTKNAPKEA